MFIKTIALILAATSISLGPLAGAEAESFLRGLEEASIRWGEEALVILEEQSTGGPETMSLLGRQLVSPPPSAKAAAEYEAALKRWQKDRSEENTIWLGRRAAYAGKYREAVRVFSEGLERFPESDRLLRHRGHRFITLRNFARAEKDLALAAKLVQGRPRETEPDGAPNRLGIPLSSTQFNIHYHLGLARYLRGDFAGAERAYRNCLDWSDNDDLLVATADWLYMTLRRLGKDGEARAILAGIRPDMEIVENGSYHRRLLMYKGLVSPESLLETGEGEADPALALATQGYGLGNWHLSNGDTARAVEVFERVVAGSSWAAFGFIAAEAELARLGTAVSRRQDPDDREHRL